MSLLASWMKFNEMKMFKLQMFKIERNNEHSMKKCSHSVLDSNVIQYLNQEYINYFVEQKDVEQGFSIDVIASMRAPNVQKIQMKNARITKWYVSQHNCVVFDNW